MSQALPDRYADSNAGGLGARAGASSGPPHVVTNNFLVSVSFAVGACGVAVMGMSLQLKTTEFFNFGNYILHVLDQMPLVTFSGYASLLMGLYGIFTGALLGLAGLFSLKMPRLVYVALFMLFLDAVIHIGAGVVVSQGVQMLDDSVYKRSKTSVADEGSFTSRVIHMQVAMFNGCCASQGWSRETFNTTGRNGVSPDAQDDTPEVDSCGSLHADNIRGMASATDLRSCYSSTLDYAVMNYTVGRNLPRVCDTLEQAMVNVQGKKIPGTNVDVMAYTNGTNILPVAGLNSYPNYGCGLGYALAFQAAMLIWAVNILSPIGTAFIACGIIEALLFLLVCFTQYSCSRQSESSQEAYARYMEEIAQAAPQQAQFEQYNPASNRMSMNVAAYASSEFQQDPNGGSRRMSVNNNDPNNGGGSRRMSVQNSDPNSGSRRLSVQNSNGFDNTAGNRQSTQSTHSSHHHQQHQQFQQQQNGRPMSVQRPMSMQGGAPPPQYYQQQQPQQYQQQQPSMVPFNVDDKI